MAKPELGMKRTCVSCNTRFYDLQKSPAICPKCGTEQPIEVPRPRRAGGNVAEEKRAKKPEEVADIEDAVPDVEVAEDDADEDVLEDTSDLEDDADAISSDIEVETDGEPEEH
jgi:uncharacterized protein (TIGR02300 family)